MPGVHRPGTAHRGGTAHAAGWSHDLPFQRPLRADQRAVAGNSALVACGRRARGGPDSGAASCVSLPGQAVVNLLEHENDLIVAYVLATGPAPSGQFLGLCTSPTKIQATLTSAVRCFGPGQGTLRTFIGWGVQFSSAITMRWAADRRTSAAAAGILSASFSNHLHHENARTGPVRAYLVNTRLTALRDTRSGECLPELRKIVSRDRKLDLAAAVLSSNYYPVPINKARWRLAERNRRLASREHVVPQRLGRRDHKCIRTDGQPLWATQGNPHTAGASKSASAEDPDTGEGSFKAHPRLYLGTQRTVTWALTVSPDIGNHNHAKNCGGKGELHDYAHELTFMKTFTLAVAIPAIRLRLPLAVSSMYDPIYVRLNSAPLGAGREPAVARHNPERLPSRRARRYSLARPDRLGTIPCIRAGSASARWVSWSRVTHPAGWLPLTRRSGRSHRRGQRRGH